MAANYDITIYDIAQEAGVSVATVSRVLTGKAKVSEEKKQRIEEVIRKYDFQPNSMARNLSSTRTSTIGFLTADIRNPYYSRVAVECEQVATERGYSLLICNSFSRLDMEQELLNRLEQQRVNSVILIGGSVDSIMVNEDFADRVNRLCDRMPVVVVGQMEGTDCLSVRIDQAKAMSQVMDYLLELGHRHIVLAGGRSDVRGTAEKRLRFKQMLHRAGIPFKDEYIVEESRYDADGGYACMQKIFQQEKLPSVIIAINDFTAAGIVRALTEKGLSVPGDISVISFDNTFISQVTSPQLTSVDYNYEDFGKKIVTTAIDAIEKKAVQLMPVKVEPTLVIRNSCAKVNPDPKAEE